MARITVEDCLARIPNRFELVVIASQRAKDLLKGSLPLVQADNKEVVTALREIAAGKVWKEDPRNVGLCPCYRPVCVEAAPFLCSIEI